MSRQCRKPTATYAWEHTALAVSPQSMSAHSPVVPSMVPHELATLSGSLVVSQFWYVHGEPSVHTKPAPLHRAPMKQVSPLGHAASTPALSLADDTDVRLPTLPQAASCSSAVPAVVTTFTQRGASKPEPSRL